MIFQKAGAKTSKIIKYSNLPSNIKKQERYLENGCMNAKELVGPAAPKAKPILFSIHATVLIDVSASIWSKTRKTIEAIVDCCTWTRISLDASNPKAYEKTHGMTAKNFDRVINNISHLTTTKNKRGGDLTFGFGT